MTNGFAPMPAWSGAGCGADGPRPPVDGTTGPVTGDGTFGDDAVGDNPGICGMPRFTESGMCESFAQIARLMSSGGRTPTAV